MRTNDHRRLPQRFDPRAIAAAGIAVLVTSPMLFADGEEPPTTVVLEGKVRDFRERSQPEGHTDFEQTPSAGFGHYSGNVSLLLGDDGRPQFTGNGFKVTREWRDNQARAICYTLYDPSAGDLPGSVGPSSSGGIDSSESFNQWFDDVLGVNQSKPLAITLRRMEDGTYVFDDKLDLIYSELGGFFPIEDDLFGNPGGTPDRNFHFTYELRTRFTYNASETQMFQFVGDDDVWVFIDGRLVIDLGGVHSATEQYVDLARLALTDGETYTLDFFFAERHRTQSNFRIQTSLLLESAAPDAVTNQFD